jgi:RNA-directed DNA polymerase
MEKIPEDAIPATKKSLQSSFSWKQAESTVTTETNSQSQSARLLAIRQVTQLNAGKKTAGTDGKASLTFEERLTLATELSTHHTNWKHQGLREIPIPKKDGTTRMLKVPTIADRAWQCLPKYALEPAHEATFHARSYGFRTGRSAHDAQKLLFSNLNSSANGIDKRVIELDIEKCFDRINHSAIIDNLIATSKAIKKQDRKCVACGLTFIGEESAIRCS